MYLQNGWIYELRQWFLVTSTFFVTFCQYFLMVSPKIQEQFSYFQMLTDFGVIVLNIRRNSNTADRQGFRQFVIYSSDIISKGLILCPEKHVTSTTIYDKLACDNANKPITLTNGPRVMIEDQVWIKKSVLSKVTYEIGRWHVLVTFCKNVESQGHCILGFFHQ